MAAVLLFASTGLVSAAETATGPCDDPPQEEERLVLNMEIEEGKYLYLPQGEQDLDKFGIWHETNRRTGLQTEHCWREGVVRVYSADLFEGLAVP